MEVWTCGLVNERVLGDMLAVICGDGSVETS